MSMADLVNGVYLIPFHPRHAWSAGSIILLDVLVWCCAHADDYAQSLNWFVEVQEYYEQSNLLFPDYWKISIITALCSDELQSVLLRYFVPSVHTNTSRNNVFPNHEKVCASEMISKRTLQPVILETQTRSRKFHSWLCHLQPHFHLLKNKMKNIPVLWIKSMRVAQYKSSEFLIFHAHFLLWASHLEFTCVSYNFIGFTCIKTASLFHNAKFCWNKVITY